MAYVKTMDLTRIIDVINSTNDTLFFNSKEEFTEIMEKMKFYRVDENYSFSVNVIFTYTGVISDQPMVLMFTSLNQDNTFQLVIKSFIEKYEDIESVYKYFRTTNLPTRLEYHQNGNIQCITFHKDNKEHGSYGFPSKVIFDVEKGKEIRQEYNNGLDETIKVHSISIDIEKDVIEDAKIEVNKKMIDLKQLSEIIPSVNLFTHENIFNLDKYVTDDVINLIDMVVI